MAVAVKNMPEAPSQGALERLPVASLVGAFYVLASIAVVFFGVPAAWSQTVSPWLAEALNPFVDGAVKLMVMVAVAIVLVFLGTRLAGPHPPHGIRAGIFAGIVTIFVAGLLTQWIGFLLENWLYQSRLLGSAGATAGLALTGVVGVVLLFVGFRLFFKPKFERRLIEIEDQGWFSASLYKRLQGLRVRRGTILGILLLAGCGIWTMLSHGTLNVGAADWQASIPFTGKVRVEKVAGVDTVYVADPGDSDLKANSIVRKQDFDAARAKMEQEGKRPPSAGLIDRFALRDMNDQGLEVPNLPQPAEDVRLQATGAVVYQGITILPNVKFTLPILLALAALWLAFRVVSYPTFADFLIATEAELNKVSWTTRKRLKQDTIVVLVTVILLTAFLFVVDQVWAQVLTRIGVLQIDTTSQENKGPREQPW